MMDNSLPTTSKISLHPMPHELGHYFGNTGIHTYARKMGKGRSRSDEAIDAIAKETDNMKGRESFCLLREMIRIR